MSRAGDASAILEDLRGMWRSLGEGRENAILRACSMTLLVMAAPEDDPQETGETIASLMRHHPARVVVIRRGAKGDPQARATIDCWRPFGKLQQVCSERIEAESAEGRLNELMPLIRGVLVPDLPVMAWFRCLRTALSEEARQVITITGQSIIDTSRIADWSDASSVIRKIRSNGGRTAALAWTRLTPWRETIHGLFSLPSHKGREQSIRDVCIEWSGAGTPSTVAYLASWLKLASPHASVELRQASAQMPPPGAGRIRRVWLSGDGVSITLRRPEAAGVAIEIESDARAVLFPVWTESELLKEQLGVSGVDSVYEDVLANALAGVHAA